MLPEFDIKARTEGEMGLNANSSYAQIFEFWNKGGISSQDFFPIILGQALTSKHFLGEGFASRLTDIPINDLIKGINNSPIMLNAYQKGLNNQNPDTETLEANYGFLPGFKKITLRLNRENQQIDIAEDGLIDPSLADSLLLHSFLSDWDVGLYSREKESSKYFLPISDIINSNFRNPEEAEKVLKWLHAKALFYHAQKMQVVSLTRWADPSITTKFKDLDHFFNKVAPAMYFLGGEKRLSGQIADLEEALPLSFADSESRLLILSGYQMSRTKEDLTGDSSVLEQVTKALTEEGRNEVKLLLAQICARDRSYLPNRWIVCEIEGMEDLIKAHDKKYLARGRKGSPEGAKESGRGRGEILEDVTRLKQVTQSVLQMLNKDADKISESNYISILIEPTAENQLLIAEKLRSGEFLEFVIDGDLLSFAIKKGGWLLVEARSRGIKNRRFRYFTPDETLSILEQALLPQEGVTREWALKSKPDNYKQKK